MLTTRPHSSPLHPLAQEEGFGTPVESTRESPPTFQQVRTPHFAQTPVFVQTRRGNDHGVPTPLTWAAKSEWPGGMMTPTFDGAGATPEGSWLTGPVPFFNPGEAKNDNVARALPLTPMSTGRFKQDANVAARSASSGDAIANSPIGASVSKPTRNSPKRTPKSLNRLSRVLASPAKGTEVSGGLLKLKNESVSASKRIVQRSLDQNFDTNDENDSTVNMMTPSPSRKSGRLDSPMGSMKKSPLMPGTSPARLSPRQNVTSPAAKMQAHAIVSLANLREEMEDKERVWGDALAEAEAELAGAKRDASQARLELAEEKAKTPEKLKQVEQVYEKSDNADAKEHTPPKEEDTQSISFDEKNSDKNSNTSHTLNNPLYTSSSTPKSDSKNDSSVFLQAKVSSLERELGKLTAQMTSVEKTHQQKLDSETSRMNTLANARVEAAKEETAASFKREKDLWAEVHKLREAVTMKKEEESTSEKQTSQKETLETSKALESLELEKKLLKKKLIEMESQLRISTDDAERFRLESDALAGSLAETTRRLEHATMNSSSTSDLIKKEEERHGKELADAEEALANAKAALEKSTSAEQDAAQEAEKAREEADVQVASEREAARQLKEERELLTSKLETFELEREKERKDAKHELKEAKKSLLKLETKLADAERKLAVAEVAEESRRAEQEISVELTQSARKTEALRTQVAVERAEHLEQELGMVRMKIVSIEDGLASAEAVAREATARAEAATADAQAARQTADSVRTHAALDRDALLRAESDFENQKADTAFQLAEAARSAAERDAEFASLHDCVSVAESSAQEAQSELASVRGALAYARAEASASAKDCAAAAKARENAEAKAKEAVSQSEKATSQLAALKSETARVVSELASSRAAARGGEDATSKLSAANAINDAVSTALEESKGIEEQLKAKIRHLEVEVERFGASLRAAKIERDEIEEESFKTTERLQMELAEARTEASNTRSSTHAGSSLPSTPTERQRSKSTKHRKRQVPQTDGKGRTPRRAHDILSETETASDSDFDAYEFDGAQTPAAVAGLVGLANPKNRSPRSNPSSNRKHPSRSRDGFEVGSVAMNDIDTPQSHRSKRWCTSVSFAAGIVLFAVFVSAAHGATGTGACAGGIFGVLAAFFDEWLSGTVRARFRVQCEGVMPS